MRQDDSPEQPEIDEAIRYYDGLMTPAEAASFRARAGASEAFAQRALEVRDVLEELAALRVVPDPDVVEEVTKEQRALWWKHRLRLSEKQLKKHWRMAEAGLEAAVEVTLGAVRNASQLLAEPAAQCLRPDAGFDFRLLAASPARESHAIGSAEARSEDEAAVTGTFVTSRIQGARVTVSDDGTGVAVEFLEQPAPDVVVLIPEEPSREPKVARTDANLRAAISGLEPGAYLLAVPEPVIGAHPPSVKAKSDTRKRLRPFQRLAEFVAQNAAQVLGVHSHPLTGAPLVDLAAARELITMLEELCETNIAPEDHKLLMELANNLKLELAEADGDIEAAAPRSSSVPSELVLCSRCGLMQHRTESGRCQRCDEPLLLPKASQ